MCIRDSYERALDRMVREVAAIHKSSRDMAMGEILDTLSKARSRQAAKAAKEAEAANEAEGENTDGNEDEAAA